MSGEGFVAKASDNFTSTFCGNAKALESISGTEVAGSFRWELVYETLDRNMRRSRGETAVGTAFIGADDGSGGRCLIGLSSWRRKSSDPARLDCDPTSGSSGFLPAAKLCLVLELPL